MPNETFAPIAPVATSSNSRKPLGYVNTTIEIGGEYIVLGSIPVWKDSSKILRALLSGAIEGNVDVTKQDVALSGYWDPSQKTPDLDTSVFK